MLRIITVSLIAVSLLRNVSASAQAEPATNLVQALEPLRPLLGKTWKGQFHNAKPEKPSYDVALWERALNGQAVRITHSINQGEYGGETIIMCNPKTGRLEFHYFTTAGFQTHGTINFEGNKFITTEEVIGNESGVTQVKATSEILPDGRMHIKSRYLKKGEWEDGHEVLYAESPEAKVVFK